MSFSLWEIDNTIDELTDRLVDPETGEIDEQVLAELDAFGMERKQKIEHLALKEKNIRAEVAALDAEIKSLTQRKKQASNHADRLDTYIANSLKGEAFSSARAKITWRTSTAVDIINEDAIPDRFLRVKTESKPDKTLIKEAIAGGEEVPGAVMVTRNNMSIK